MQIGTLASGTFLLTAMSMDRYQVGGFFLGALKKKKMISQFLGGFKLSVAGSGSVVCMQIGTLASATFLLTTMSMHMYQVG